ncbi:glutathione synthetase [Apiospora rasikravindrae]|uniref:Glutathione synthetase n=1 Tax=Apiospora rasikravindrae TaxID=990691 RepID=A0ABR1UD11_9PEZI
MPSTLPANYPPDLTASESERLAEVVKDWAAAHGLSVRPPPNVVPAESDPVGIMSTAVPVTIFPSPFPQICYDQGKVTQKAYNELYAAISQDEEFLAQIVKDIGESDDFITELWKVHLKHLSLGLFRSDYMVHQTTPEADPQIKQVEFNTIASSFGGLSSHTSALHKPSSLTAIPPPSTTSASFSLVQDGERNVFDQRHLEYEVQAPPHTIPVFRLPFSQIKKQTHLAEGDGRQLLFTPPQLPKHTFEVAVVYMRSGYGPGDYPDASAWEARYHIERSAAIKCPSVLTQVAGTKKVQQVLATPPSDPMSEPSVLRRFISSDDDRNTRRIHHTDDTIAALQRTFTNIYPLDSSPAGKKARTIAFDEDRCQSYVLKPQREGGGNNIYRSAIPGFLKSIPEAHWDAYILMELITPPPVHNTILRMGKLEHGGVICELGIYGTCLWDQREKQGHGIVMNEQAGYLLRTKGDKSEEGGVAAGFGCMDSCALVGGGHAKNSGVRHG